MKVTVNKDFFLGQALPIMKFDRISIAAYGGILSVASFGNVENFRVPAFVLEPGQAYLTAVEWHDLVMKVKAEANKMVDIIV
ncbi:MAG: hypothetical protein H6Q65_873 [Firmicutes bacterium]|nr:hypothetical protein [Bacillota bacterium]